jgi:peptidoglycan hydrolase-like protein with peptidoglycan-binding domain
MVISRLSSELFDLLRRPPALLAISFAIIATAIATNALFLQSRPHPSPLVITRDVPVAPEHPQPEDAREVRHSDDLVLAVQTALRRVGYYSGSLDGLTGPQTEAAIQAFEDANGLPQTGTASLELLAEIKGAKADDTASLTELAAGQTPAAEPDTRVAAVQHALAIAAYGPLRTDGVFGPETREAIIRFQRDHSLPPTGEISDALIVELRASGALQDN